MSGAVNGVKPLSLYKAKNPDPYVLCYAHKLNFSADGCSKKTLIWLVKRLAY
jgi:hypothetical protein